MQPGLALGVSTGQGLILQRGMLSALDCPVQQGHCVLPGQAGRLLQPVQDAGL